MKLSTYYYIPMIFWAALIFVLSAIPGDTIVLPSFWNSDKFAHIFMYFVLAVLILLTLLWAQRDISFIESALLTFLVSIAYGGIIEILQQYVFIHRNGDFLDFIANSIGAALGVIFMLYFKKRY